MKNMFCPKCGAEAQTVESYCKRCGEWLPDIENLAKPRLFRKSSRQEKVRKIRIIQALSALLSLISAVIILSVLAGRGSGQILIIAALFNIIVVVYQVINFYLGYKTQPKITQGRTEAIKEIEIQTEKQTEMLNAASPTEFLNRASVTENTTKLLEALPQSTERDKQG